MFDKLKTFISKKLLVAVLTAVLLAINNQLSNPLDPATIKDIITVIVAYILGQSAVDVTTILKTGGK
jgi:hypothetical protein